MSRTFTLAEIMDAMERDITPKAIGLLDALDWGHCAIGGAAHVLGVPGPILLRGLMGLPACIGIAEPVIPDSADRMLRDSLARQIADLNDFTGLSKKAIAALVRDAGCDLTRAVSV